MIRVGVIGLGFGLKVHVPAFRSDPRCEVVAIASPDAEKAAEAAAKCGIPRSYSSHGDMLRDKEIDAVSLAVPPLVQKEILPDLIRAGKHVFCEKPLGTGSVMAHILHEEAEKAGLVVAVDFEFPELSVWHKTKRAIHSGEWGKILHFRYDWHLQTYANQHGLKSWKTSPEQMGGTLYGFMSHVFYNLEWMLGPIARLRACTEDPRSDLIQTLVDMENSAAGTLSISTNTPATFCHRFEIFLERGVARLVNNGSDWMTGFQWGIAPSAEVKMDFRGLSEAKIDGDSRIIPVSSLVHKFVDRISGNRKALIPDLRAGERVEHWLEIVHWTRGAPAKEGG